MTTERKVGDLENAMTALEAETAEIVRLVELLKAKHRDTLRRRCA